MIVIATHNGKDHLPGLFDALETYGTGGRKVLLLDTGTTCKGSLDLIQELSGRKWSFELESGRTPYQAYDSGAYVHAYRNWEAGSYLFMQDSIRPKSPDWVTAFECRLTYGVGCVPWLIFPMQWNCQEQVDFVMEKCEVGDWPPHGIFGPIFLATRSALAELDARGLLEVLPGSKTEQMAMERFWPTAFIKAGIAVRPVEAAFEERSLRQDAYRHMTKRFALRA